MTILSAIFITLWAAGGVLRRDDIVDHGSSPSQWTVLSTVTVGDEAAYNAFPGLTYRSNVWWCAYRSATTHGSVDGIVRVKASTDKTTWTQTAILNHTAGTFDDLRDPRLWVTPAGGLAMLANAYNGATHSNLVYLSANGTNWSTNTLSPQVFLYGPQVHNGTNFAAGKYSFAWSADCINWSSNALTAGTSSETVLWFDDSDNAHIVRREYVGSTQYHLHEYSHAASPWTSWAAWTHAMPGLGGPGLDMWGTTPVIGSRNCDLAEARVFLYSVGTDGTLTARVGLAGGATWPHTDCGYGPLVITGNVATVAWYSGYVTKPIVYVSEVLLQ